MRDIVFLVDDIREDGELVTPTDRLRSISDNWQENLYEKNKDYYTKYTGKRVKFARLADAMSGSLDPSKRYLYFVPIEDWKCHLQLYFNVVSREKQEWMAKNGVGIYFAQDFEMYPNLDVNFFGNYLGWVLLCQLAHAPVTPIYFSLISDVAEKHRAPLKNAFGDRARFVTSPLLVNFARDELFLKLGTIDVHEIVRAYLSSPKEKSYVALTRDSKYHRISMMHGLRAHGLLSDGYVSYLMPRPYSPDSMWARSAYADRVRADMASPLPRMTVDELPESLVPGIQAGIGGVLPIRHMTASCYDLVQETATNYEGGPLTLDMSVVTEKVVKSLFLGRPFLLNGGPRALALLRRWGFETFPMLFDESYDDREEYVDRQEVIVRNVARWAGKREEFMSVVRSREVTALLDRNSQRVTSFDFESTLIDEVARAER